MIIKTLLTYLGLTAIPLLNDERIHGAKNREAVVFAAHQRSIRRSLREARALVEGSENLSPEATANKAIADMRALAAGVLERGHD